MWLRLALHLGSLSAQQRAAAMHLLGYVLSAMGYEKVLEIMGSDQALADAGTNFASGEAVYTIGIFEKPSVDQPWMLEFGGHHLALNVAMAGADGVMTPSVLARENDTVFALLDTLSAVQRKEPDTSVDELSVPEAAA